MGDVRTSLPTIGLWAMHSRSPPNYAEIEGVRMQYVEQGTGDAILFLH